jgi:hypothetical protein
MLSSVVFTRSKFEWLIASQRFQFEALRLHRGLSCAGFHVHKKACGKDQYRTIRRKDG